MIRVEAVTTHASILASLRLSFTHLPCSAFLFFYYFFKKILFVYLRERENECRQGERLRGRRRLPAKQGVEWRLDPRTLGS